MRYKRHAAQAMALLMVFIAVSLSSVIFQHRIMGEEIGRFDVPEVDIQIRLIEEGGAGPYQALLLVRNVENGISSVYYELTLDGVEFAYHVPIRNLGESETYAAGMEEPVDTMTEDLREWSVLEAEEEKIISMSKVIGAYVTEELRVRLAYCDQKGNYYSFQKDLVSGPVNPADADAVAGDGIVGSAVTEEMEHATAASGDTVNVDTDGTDDESSAVEGEIEADTDTGNVAREDETAANADAEEAEGPAAEGADTEDEAAANADAEEAEGPAAEDVDIEDEAAANAYNENTVVADTIMEDVIAEIASANDVEAVTALDGVVTTEGVPVSDDDVGNVFVEDVITDGTDWEEDPVGDATADEVAGTNGGELTGNEQEDGEDNEELFENEPMTEPGNEELPVLEVPDRGIDVIELQEASQEPVEEPWTSVAQQWIPVYTSPQYTQPYYYNTSSSRTGAGGTKPADNTAAAGEESEKTDEESSENGDSEKDKQEGIAKELSEEETTAEETPPNTEGSFYDLSALSEINGQYLKTVEDLMILETNRDRLLEDSVIVSVAKDGETFELEKDKDYTFRMTGNSKDLKTYKYTIKRQVFAEDGIYRVFLFSKDAAGNQNSNEARDAAISFSIDNTEPLIISCADSREQRESGTREVRIRDNIRLSDVDIYLGEEKVAYEVNGETYRFTVPEGNEASDIKVIAKDTAGNVYERTLTDYVSAGSKKLRPQSSTGGSLPLIICACVAAGAAGWVLYRKVKPKLHKENGYMSKIRSFRRELK